MCSPQIAVLVVEDESLVRLNIVAELEDSGLAVLEADNALDAIGILAAQPKVDVIFTDIDMPGDINGLQLARIVKLRYPAIQVIVTSGRRGVADHELPEAARFFPKPYSIANIVQAIRHP